MGIKNPAVSQGAGFLLNNYRNLFNGSHCATGTSYASTSDGTGVKDELLIEQLKVL